MAAHWRKKEEPLSLAAAQLAVQGYTGPYPLHHPTYSLTPQFPVGLQDDGPDATR